MPKKRKENAPTVAQAAEKGPDQEWRKGLLLREQAFVAEYLVDFNATAAATRIGYKGSNAHNTGYAMLKKPQIKAAIENLFASRGVNAQRIVDEISAVAFARVTDFVEIKDGRVVVRNTDDLDETQKRALGEISETITKYGTAVNVKLADKMAALNSLARAAGLHKDKLEVTGKDGGPMQTEVTRESTQALIEGLFDRLKERQEDANGASQPVPPKDK